ncbi:MAG: hypothetical protein HDS14_05975 [Bacteroides sp.]|nr:hypothetical protein [Bacteroides sp.]
MTDDNFTRSLQQWVNAPDNLQDPAQGAMLLLQLTNNRALYARMTANPRKSLPYLRSQLRRYLDYRLARMTADQVAEMEKQVAEIVSHTLADTDPATPEDPEGPGQQPHKNGKRPDHDSLPEDIRALWTENLSILRRMRELHLQLRNLSPVSLTCPASDRYPFLKELINLDKKRLLNWKTYDQYIPSQDEK